MRSSGRGDKVKLRTALDYAAHGWAVFPVQGISGGRCCCRMDECSSPGKHPLTRRGVKDATIGSEVIAAWWRRWPNANLALATGGASGVVVIDVDPPRGELSLSRLVEAGFELPDTAAVRTGSGGGHLYYLAPGFPLGNSAGRLPGVGLELPGIDLRADGGYVVAPPSVHIAGSRYEWIDVEAGLAPAPAWLVQTEQIPTTAPASPPRVTPGSNSPYGLAALSGELEELDGAPVGARNHTLNRCAFRLGRLVAGGELNEVEVVQALRTRALSRGLSAREIKRTISSGLAAGRRLPRCRPRS